jgi:hypothetical protein
MLSPLLLPRCSAHGSGMVPGFSAQWMTSIMRPQGIVPLSTVHGLVWLRQSSVICVHYVCSGQIVISVVWIINFFLLGVAGHLVHIGLSVSMYKFLAKGWTVVLHAWSSSTSQLPPTLLRILHAWKIHFRISKHNAQVLCFVGITCSN